MRRGVLELDELVCVCVWMISILDPFYGEFPDPFRCLLRWWLVLFIEALVLFPNVRREGIPQRLILKGDN